MTIMYVRKRPAKYDFSGSKLVGWTGGGVWSWISSQKGINLGAVGSGTAYSNAMHSTGKYYFEVTPSSFPNGDALIGIVKDGLWGRWDTATAKLWRDASQYSNNGVITVAPSYLPGNVVRVAVDFDAGKIWFGKNGSWNSTPGTGAANLTFTPGSSWRVALLNDARSNNTSRTIYTVNFGATAFTYAVPTGFIPGF